MIDRSLDARMNAAIARIAVVVVGRMQRLTRVTDVMREVAGEAQRCIAIIAARCAFELHADALDCPRQRSRALDRARSEPAAHPIDVRIELRPWIGAEQFHVDEMPSLLSLAATRLEA